MLKIVEEYANKQRPFEYRHSEMLEKLSGQSIIYFGPEKWEGMWRNRHQLMSRFARENRVMYVEPVVSLSKLRCGDYSWSDFWQAVKRKRVTKTKENVLVYHSLPYVPISGRFPLNKISWWVWNFLFKTTMKAMGFKRPIIWLSRPNMFYFIGNYNEKIRIYHVVDEYSAYGNPNKESKEKVRISEQKMLKKADMVIVVSHKLYETKSAYNDHTYVVPNGVDYESYSRALISDELPPSDITRLQRPIIGYSGLISKRLNLDLLEHIAINHPEWSLVFIGAVNYHWCEFKLNRLRRLKNVHFLGLKAIKEVPHYIKAFDVCFIPYVIDEETENLSPLKLYDFMAIGKPIVTTAFPSAQEFKDIVYIADSKESFTHSIEEALLESDNGLFNARRHSASLNTWEHRVNQLSRLIESRLAQR